MTITRDGVLAVLAGIACPGGGDLVSRDLVRALVVDGGSIRFVIEAASPDAARSLAPVQTAAETALRGQPGVELRVFDVSGTVAPRWRGVANYLEMLEAQRSLFESEQEYIRLQQRRLVNAVDLYKALGGWDDGKAPAS